ncbi:putative NAD-dependent epimerase/dehydratase family protein [Blattamonas nauphoetae]|uniref:NAD-dependent epimerase/dehydratase family protein n=1 Tax=Blattamonas nauphoetae TaxID=2049346 RepID=A0ABQ9YAV0_9EUKA|nr:putative NAD-dependent epimerase/dehydratase family protein [Blattamonas nauphoetae]
MTGSLVLQEYLFQNIDAAFFCIGAYTGTIPDEEFRRVTVDFAVAFASALRENSPNATLCLLSGNGADSTGKSSMAFAKYKGQAENQISALQLGHFYSFRPSYIYPVTKRKEPTATYSFTRAIYPVLKLFGKNVTIKSTELAKAMFIAGMNGAPKEILENADILALLPVSK